MSLQDLIMPKLGESIMEATILKWHKQVGDTVAMDETVLDIATDKVDSEVPSTAAGTIAELLYKENDVVPIGAVIARIETGGGGSKENDKDSNTQTSPTTTSGSTQAANNTANQSTDEADAQAVPYQPSENTIYTSSTSNNTQNTNRFYSPLVLSIAQQEGIALQDLEKIAGTGQDGRVSKKDILAYVAKLKAAPTTTHATTTSSAPAQQQSTSTPATQVNTGNEAIAQSDLVPHIIKNDDNVEIIEMNRMRKLIAKHMVESKRISAHVTSFVETDVTNLVLWREKIKKAFEIKEGEKITLTPLLIEAVVRTLRKFPLLNSSMDMENVYIKKHINIGMAAALPDGNLIVPVIKNADQLNLVGLTKQVNSLAAKARTGKLKPDDTVGGTFTISNVGIFGSLMGTPIINQPQVAILATGTIKKRPVVIETPQGDVIAIRQMMYLSLTYDHRIIDGALGSTFLSAVSKELESFDMERSL